MFAYLHVILLIKILLNICYNVIVKHKLNLYLELNILFSHCFSSLLEYNGKTSFNVAI